MEKIEIDNFKAFNSRIAIIPTAAHKNMLIYGENGAGKTSLYEALLLTFYHEKLLRPHLSVGAQPEQISTMGSIIGHQQVHHQQISA